jgi:rod shape-determining protein MreD
VNLSHTSPEQVEVYRFSLIATILIPVVALFLQARVPLFLPAFSLLDLPLLVTIFFGVARRNPISGLVTGCLIGLLQDSLTPHALGLYGIAKTVVGYGASSLGVRLDVEHSAARLIVTFGFYLVHQALYFFLLRGLVQLSQDWSWGHQLLAAVANAVLAVPLFLLLDRFRQRT